MQVAVPAAVSEKLIKISRASDKGLYVLCFAALNVVLRAYTGVDHLVVGLTTPRGQLEEHRLIFAGNNTSGGQSFKEVLGAVQKSVLGAFANGDVHMDIIIEKLSAKTENPPQLFNTAFIYDKIQAPDDRLKDFDLFITLSACASGQDLQLILNHCPRYDKETVIALAEAYLRVLDMFPALPGKIVADIDVLSSAEKQRLLETLNDTASEFPSDQTIHQLFNRQVERAPSEIALVTENPEESGDTSLTYAQLDHLSSEVAELLIKKGVTPGDIVAVTASRRIRTVVALLGIMKAGAAYMPISSYFPPRRIRFILKDSNTAAWIVPFREDMKEIDGLNHSLDDILKDFPVEMIYMDQYPAENADTDSGNENVSVSMTDKTLTKRESAFDAGGAGDLAYVIYTSGSTGLPKGVLVEHINVVRLVMNNNFHNLTPDDRLLQAGAIEFDASTFELWATLLNGARLYLASTESLLSAENLKKCIHTNGITIILFTAALLNRLSVEDVHVFRELKAVFTGGDTASPPQVSIIRKHYPDLKLLNCYGPTENTCISTTFRILGEEFGDRVSIGKPIANSTAYIVDKNNRLVPPGVSGELVLGGLGVARGYMNNPELTAKCFIEPARLLSPSVDNEPMPAGGRESDISVLGPNEPGNSIYKTGDLARWLPDGNLDFLGRIDNQVKVRGFRIELGEIESLLLKHEAILEAVVAIKNFQSNTDTAVADKLICAYYVPVPGGSDTGKALEGKLREYLIRTLPDYMIPSALMELKKIPITSNGKVDHRALPDPGVSLDTPYAPPTDDVESNLVDIWTAILFGEEAVPDGGKTDRPIGIDDNFFDLGGHSLKAVSLLSRIYRVLHVSVSQGDFFSHLTIRKLAQLIRGADISGYIAIDPAEEKEYYLLSSVQKRLYVMQQMDPAGTLYNMPFTYPLGEECDKDRIENAFKGLVGRHDAFRISFQLLAATPLHGAGTPSHGVSVPVQRRRREVEFALEEQTTAAGFVRPFDLSKAPLLRARLVKEENRYILLVDMHHIISDGLSQQVLIEDFMAFFQENPLPELRLSYIDFAQWQNELLVSGEISKQEEFWREQFAGGFSRLNLITDFTRPSIGKNEGEDIAFIVPKHYAEKLREYAREAEASVFMVVLAIFNVFLSKLDAREDIIVGTVTEGRRHPDLQKIIGMFINTLPLRNYPRVEDVFLDFLKDVKERTIQVFDNQDFQFDDLVRLVEQRRDPGRNPIFDILFSFSGSGSVREDNSPEGEEEKSPIPLTGDVIETEAGHRVGVTKARAKFDILFSGGDMPDGGMQLVFEYNTELYKRETICRYVDYFQEITKSITENKLIKLKDVSISVRMGVADESSSLVHDDDDDFGF
ncbi:MAG: amino acid adenylation domain-containing protein [bacterium]|nr:amino acid adenylation domain-containing protein [bacterium]